MISHLAQAYNLVILVHGSQVPATRGKVRVTGDRTFMQNCVKKAVSSLTLCSQPQAVGHVLVTMVILILTMSRYEAFGSTNKHYRFLKNPDLNLQW